MYQENMLMISLYINSNNLMKYILLTKTITSTSEYYYKLLCLRDNYDNKYNTGQKQNWYNKYKLSVSLDTLLNITDELLDEIDYHSPYFHKKKFVSTKDWYVNNNFGFLDYEIVKMGTHIMVEV